MLLQHAENLRNQTMPTERIYVFDNGDSPPAAPDGRVIVAPEKLTVYQAWNLAIAAVKTPYVMNLNLDDRLAPDAVAALERVLDNGADLGGGDWKISYDEEETNRVVPVQPAGSLPFVPDWPPAPGTPTRLGSGSGDRGTLGPACMWRMSLHGEVGRYPWRFGDGSLIGVIGDLVWWEMLKGMKKKIVRLPSIIGNYYSHPHEQCEFRSSPSREMELLLQHGIDNN